MTPNIQDRGIGRVLVTGGAGFIGSHLVRRLLRSPALQITVVDNLTGSRRNALPEHRRIRFVKGDIQDPGVIGRAADGAELVFHLAALANVIGAEQDAEAALGTNVCGTLEVLKAARAAGARRFVFASSREVYGDAGYLPVPEDAALAAKNVYGESKVEAESLVRRMWPEAVILRLANVYGPGDRDRVIPIFLERARRAEELVLYGGDQVLDFVWVEDVVEAMLRAALDCPAAGPINIGSGIGVAISELASRIVRLSGSSSGIVRLPPRSCEVGNFVADVSRACSLLGMWRSSVPLARLPEMIGAPGREGSPSPVRRDFSTRPAEA